ncbi:hypothetical protein ACO0OL_001515 [Hanseniaspora opuntiae]
MSLFRSNRILLKKLNSKDYASEFFAWQKNHLLKPEVFNHFVKFVEFYKLHFVEKSSNNLIKNEEFFQKYFVNPIAKSNETSKLVEKTLEEKNNEFLSKLTHKSNTSISETSQLYKYLINKSHFDDRNRLVFDINNLNKSYYQVGDVIVLNNKTNNILIDSLNLAVIIKLPSKDDLNMVCISTTEDVMTISKNNVLFRMDNVFNFMESSTVPTSIFNNLFSENPTLNKVLIPDTLFHHIPRLFMEVLELLKRDLKDEIKTIKTDVSVIIDDILRYNTDLTLNELYFKVVEELNILCPKEPYSTEPKEVCCSVYIAMLYYLIETNYQMCTNMRGMPYFNLNKSRDLKLTNPDFNIPDINAIANDYMGSVDFAELINKYKNNGLEQGDINLYDVLSKDAQVHESEHKVRHDPNFDTLKKMFENVQISPSNYKAKTKYMNPEKVDKLQEGKESAIYAIDSASTVEVDDGLSLEYLHDNKFRVNCYISAVSDFFLKDKLDERERLLLENIFARNSSLYYLSKVDKMICVDAINDHYSLSANNGNTPALKFSVIISKNSDGYTVERDTFEISKTNGYNDLNRVTYEEVDNLINTDLKETSVLKDLYNISKHLREDRKGSRFYKSLEFNNQNSVQVKSSGSDFIIDVENVEKKSQILVSEFMLLFNHLTATYCSQNNIPIIYRSCPPSLGLENDSQKIDGKIFTYTANPKYAKFITPESYYTMEPSPHYSTGFEYYTHITSPLRRLPDLLNTLVIMKHLADKSLTAEELRKLKVVFEQDVCVGSQQTKKFNKYLQKYYLLKALKTDQDYLENLLKQGGTLTTSTFGDSKQSDLSQKDELLPIQNVNIVKKTVNNYKSTLERDQKKFDSLDRVYVVFKGCIVADLEIDSKIKCNYSEGQSCKDLVLHTLDPVKLQFSVKLK